MSDNPSLRKKSAKISKVDKKIKKLVKDMKETLLAQKDPMGIGLAASQIGKNLRVFIMKTNGDKLLTVINPKIISKSKQAGESIKGEILEGCLSIPHLYGPLKRAEKIKLEYLDENGETKKQGFEGLEAQIIQHEIDHLDGTLFVDKLLKAKKPLYKQNDHGEWDEVDFGNI